MRPLDLKLNEQARELNLKKFLGTVLDTGWTGVGDPFGRVVIKGASSLTCSFQPRLAVSKLQWARYQENVEFYISVSSQHGLTAHPVLPVAALSPASRKFEWNLKERNVGVVCEVALRNEVETVFFKPEYRNATDTQFAQCSLDDLPIPPDHHVQEGDRFSFFVDIFKRSKPWRYYARDCKALDLPQETEHN
jgi:hypothetical protein